jgi:hypothetical protein
MGTSISHQITGRRADRRKQFPERSRASDRGPVRAVPWLRGWVVVVLLPAAVLLFVRPMAPRWAFMWSMALALFAGAKWLTWRRTPVDNAPLWKHVAYLLAWPGMDAGAFLQTNPPRVIVRPAVSEWSFAVAKTLFGAVLLVGGARIVPSQYPLAIGWVGLVGLVFVLHCGAFHLLSCVWRAAGIDARPLMSWPAAARSLAEFWGRRWNTAYRDLTHRFVFRPLVGTCGVRGGMLAGFVTSGLVHDLVISVPAGGGYGGPTVYFTLQGAALMLERGRLGRRLGLGRGRRGWLFAAVVLVAPVLLLFHPPFVREVLLPMFTAWRIVP